MTGNTRKSSSSWEAPAFSGASPGETREAFWPLYTAWTGSRTRLWRCHWDAFSGKNQAPTTTQAKSGGEVEFVWGFREKLHQANQEGATDLLSFLAKRRFQKVPRQLPYRPAGAELWQLDAEFLGLSFDMENSTSSEKTYGDAVESFLRYIASEPEWEELFDLITSSIDDAAKLVDKIPHELYSELKLPTTRDAPAKVLPTKPSSRGGIGRQQPSEEGSAQHG